jgi:hypothetical protein
LIWGEKEKLAGLLLTQENLNMAWGGVTWNKTMEEFAVAFF